jgi:hypothetical protein
MDIAATPTFRSFANMTHRLRDVRQVVDQGGLLEFTAFNDGWNMSVTGYELTI